MGRSKSRPARALALIAVSQLLALSLWFSASAVAPQLEDAWRLSPVQVAGLTLTVQLGFVVGALASALLNIADLVPSRLLFTFSATAAALVNLGLLTVSPGDPTRALMLRFLTGMFLAGVYPAGLKVMAGWFVRGRGMALGVLVGALTVGSASPHLVRGLGLDWVGVVITASVLAAIAALLMLRVGDGPFETRSSRFRWSQVAVVVSNRGARLATYGYLGHMWELYAMWTWVGAFLAASAQRSASGYGSIPVLTFVVIGVGGLGAWWAGSLADRVGRARIAGGAMLISGACAISTPILFGGPGWFVIPVMLVWGLTVVADSAQFSAMVTETSDDDTRGTALTLQTALGFLLTLATIWLVPRIAGTLGWRWAFPVLGLGPALGVIAMSGFARAEGATPGPVTGGGNP